MILLKTSITRKHLTKVIAKKTGIKLSDASKYVNLIITHGLVKPLINHDPVVIKSFGTFFVKHKSARIGRNPKTTEPKIISQRYVVRFKISQIFKKKISEYISGKYTTIDKMPKYKIVSKI